MTENTDNTNAVSKRAGVKRPHWSVLAAAGVLLLAAAGSVIFTGTKEASNFNFLLSSWGCRTFGSVGKNPYGPSSVPVYPADIISSNIFS